MTVIVTLTGISFLNAIGSSIATHPSIAKAIWIGLEWTENDWIGLPVPTQPKRLPETLHKVTHPGMDPSKNTQQPANTGLERDMEPKRQKVHLPSEGEDIVYTPSGKLAGMKALVTGGDSGIGRAVAIQFDMDGATVAIVYLPSEEEDAQHTKAQVEKNGGEVILIPSDLSLSTNCKDVNVRDLCGMFHLLPHLATDWSPHTCDLQHNAATRQEQGDICDISEEQWASTLRVNLDSYFHLTKYVLPHLSKGGVIVNNYATSKGAVIAFTRALSNQLVKKGIRVNAAAAGPV
ncbi:hypothetical protein BKA56DRAFT_663537 [Ilyonectria sp. MPI-CAGE-AT-0026]|nr:hypothetical protein BKA56DRAFT_663537 [Ilyonectria sp. MPI-CAGE-AT-0026]